MVILSLIAVGILALLVGWSFYRQPQTAFWRHQWPFPPLGNGLTEKGEASYRVQGIVIMVFGGGLILWGLAG